MTMEANKHALQRIERHLEGIEGLAVVKREIRTLPLDRAMVNTLLASSRDRPDVERGWVETVHISVAPYRKAGTISELESIHASLVPEGIITEYSDKPRILDPELTGLSASGEPSLWIGRMRILEPLSKMLITGTVEVEDPELRTRIAWARGVSAEVLFDGRGVARITDVKQISRVIHVRLYPSSETAREGAEQLSKHGVMA